MNEGWRQMRADDHRYLAFDIETAKLRVTDERDWKADRPLGISCAATFAEGSGDPRLWYGGTKGRRTASRLSKQQAVSLVEYLMTEVEHGYRIVTWNGVGFDFDILAEESGLIEECRRLAREHVDMMFHVVCQLGFGVSLSSAAKGMGISGKHYGLSGKLVPTLWANGGRQEVCEYVVQDVRITLELAKRCEANRHLRWVSRAGVRREMPLTKGWCSVRSAIRLPNRGSLRMRKQWPRTSFTAWLAEK